MLIGVDSSKTIFFKIKTKNIVPLLHVSYQLSPDKYSTDFVIAFISPQRDSRLRGNDSF